MVREAEASRDADTKRREAIDLKNEADTYMYNTEKQLQEHGARIPDSVKDQVKGDINSLQEAVTTDDAEKIREALERLKNSSMEIGKAIYSQSNQSQEQSQEQQQSTEGQEGEKKQ